jgi:2-polyprenyl-3-methyl-5-hydroxy-6-metoxy-1,4-benzoquinol methylase
MGYVGASRPCTVHFDPAREYFDDPSVHPLAMTFHMILRAPERYAEKVLELVRDRGRPILDVGCGMGGLLGLQ